MFKKNKTMILFALVVVFILSANYLYVSHAHESRYSSFPQIKSSDRILIFSPHPDDESLGAGGLIRKALEENASVKVVEMTNGDLMSIPQFKNYLIRLNITQFQGNVGDLRQEEAINAMKTLGLNDENIIFLGYPDGGLQPMFESHWDDDNLFHMNNGSNQFDHSPYNRSYEKNAPYSGENVEKNIEQIMNDYQPTIIVYPDSCDTHPDHRATSAFVTYAMLETGYQGLNYTYLVHQSGWPKSSPHPYQFSSIITTSDAHWYVDRMNVSDKNLKKKAIYYYSSQTCSMMTYLMSFTKGNEVYEVYPDLNVDKFGGIQMPNSSFANNEHKTDLTPYNSLITSGMAYDDNYVYLLLKYDKIDNFEYKYHLKLFKGKTVDYIDLETRNGTVEYVSLSNHSIKTSQNPRIQNANDIRIIILPRSLFYGTQYAMMSIDLYDIQKKQETDHTPWRVFKFSENSSSSNEIISAPIRKNLNIEPF